MSSRELAKVAERRRLEEARDTGKKWRRWGTYLPERQWGTVREDYSATGEAWEYLPFDHAALRAYRVRLPQDKARSRRATSTPEISE